MQFGDKYESFEIRTGINDVEHKALFRLLFLFGVALLAPLASAEETDLDRCAELESDAARLACFDAVIKERRTAAPSAGSTNAPAEPAAAEAAPPAVASQPATSPRAEAAPTEESRKEYSAVVMDMRTRPHGQIVVTLDNGETWSEQYASRTFLVEVGDTVTMKKSRFSSAYRLVAPGGRAYSMTRVDE
jgi:biotin carboxyl carrier protein